MKFFFIIDEWDAIIREAESDTEIQKAYLNLLREWFKNGNFTSKAVAAAYMTGILPIKKIRNKRLYLISMNSRFLNRESIWNISDLLKTKLGYYVTNII